jgi:signal transduction histidine kinase
LASDSCRSARNFFLLLFCCFLASCNNGPKSTIDKKELDLLRQTDKLTVLHRQKILPFVDSVYRTQKEKDPFLRVWRYRAYADAYQRNGFYPSSILYADSAIAIIDQQNLSDSIWTYAYFGAYITKGSVLYSLGRYPSSIDTYFKVKDLADRTGNKCNIGDIVDDHIGIILFKQEKYDDAIAYFKLGLEVIKGCPVNELKARQKQELLDNIGESFINLGNTDSALTYYRKALHVIETEKFNRDPAQAKVQKAVCKGVVLNNIGQILVTKNKLDSAEMFFKENILINGITYKNESRNAQLSQLNLASLYELRAQYPQMKMVLTDLRKNLDTLHNDDVETGWRKLMAEYCGKNNFPLEQLKYENSYLALKDSLDVVKITSNSSDIDKELKAKGQQINLIVLQKDNELSHLYLWITIALSLMALIIVVLIYYYYRRGKKNIQALTLLNREIGEQKDKIEFAMVELERSNTDKERIIKVVAHDLRDPIGGAATLVATIINEDLPEAYEKESWGLVEKTLTNSLTLINELVELDLGKEHIRLDKELTDINETVKQCASLIQLIAIKKGQKLHLSALPKPLNINIDKERIERMLNNLIGNAIKFSPVGETISIELEQKNKSVLIAIKDNGIGIPAEIQTEIFNTVGSTRRLGKAGEKSFGLGLSICKQIVEAHLGKIWVRSEAGKGSIFYVELPL